MDVVKAVNPFQEQELHELSLAVCKGSGAAVPVVVGSILGLPSRRGALLVRPGRGSPAWRLHSGVRFESPRGLGKCCGVNLREVGCLLIECSSDGCRQTVGLSEVALWCLFLSLFFLSLSLSIYLYIFVYFGGVSSTQFPFVLMVRVAHCPGSLSVASLCKAVARTATSWTSSSGNGCSGNSFVRDVSCHSRYQYVGRLWLMMFPQSIDGGMWMDGERGGWGEREVERGRGREKESCFRAASGRFAV